MGYRIGFDVGGTFTDFFILDEERGTIIKEKVSTPEDNLSSGLREALQQIFAEYGIKSHEVTYLSHGTTVATNAILEAEGVTTGLVTTEGFRDIVAIGREKRPNIYDFAPEKPPKFVDRKDRVEVKERIAPDGTVVEHFDEESAMAAIRELRDSDIKSVAVSFLHAYSNDEHERAFEELFQSEMDVPISLSSEVMPEIQEYERTISTILNAYIGPPVRDYLDDLTRSLSASGIETPLYVMQANGGVIRAEKLTGRMLQLINSGPAAGVLGAQEFGEYSDIDSMIVLDMGGTSADTCLIRNGSVDETTRGEIDNIPLLYPQIDVRTVGAGGGSVAWLDSADVLHVGPRSAGAYPGPACYGRGGTEPTVTDAAVHLGYLDPDYFLGGEMELDEGAAEMALESVGERIGLSPVELAEGILDIVTSNMTRAIRLVSVEKGYDPRDFALTLYGGAGPMFATRLARELGIDRAFVPRAPGVLSASGLLSADKEFNFSVSDPTTLARNSAPPIERVREIYDSLEERASAVADGDAAIRRSVDVRYAGQLATLNVAVPEEDVTTGTIRDMMDAFDEKYESIYGHASREESLEAMVWRLRTVEKTPPLRYHEGAAGSKMADAKRGTRSVYLGEETREIQVYRREELPHGVSFDGPAIVEETESTLVIGTDGSVNVDEAGNIVIEMEY